MKRRSLVRRGVFRDSRFSAVPLATTLVLTACGQQREPGSPAEAQSETGAGDGSASGGAAIEGPAIVVAPDEALTLDQLLARARDHLARERYALAVADFERAVQAVRGERRARVLLDYATALDLAGQSREALLVYRDLYDDAELDSALREQVTVRLVRLLTYFESFEEAARLAHRVDPDQRPRLEAIALYAARGLGRLEAGQLEAASEDFVRGRTLIEEKGLDRAGQTTLDMAALFYGLGELRRRKAEQIDFEGDISDFAERLEHRAQLILDAQAAYSQVMRAHDAHWSAMAGVRVGELYKRLHEALLDVPMPKQAGDEGQRALLRGALRLRYSILLDKATKMMEHTVKMVERTDEPTPWRARAERALEELDEQRRAEQEALDALPYSRATLRAALEDLDKRAGGDGRID